MRDLGFELAADTQVALGQRVDRRPCFGLPDDGILRDVTLLQRDAQVRFVKIYCCAHSK